MNAQLVKFALFEAIRKSKGRKREERMGTEEIIEKWVRAALDEADSYDFQVGEDISPYSEIKIAFDGNAADGDGNENRSQLSFAVYIHADATADGFTFPRHECEFGILSHRPFVEVYHNVWYDYEYDEIDCSDFAESVAKTKVPYAHIVSVIEALDKRFSDLGE